MKGNKINHSLHLNSEKLSKQKYNSKKSRGFAFARASNPVAGYWNNAYPKLEINGATLHLLLS